MDDALTGKSLHFASQYRVVRPDGSICWIDAHGVMVRDGSKHMLGVGVDISELKGTQESLQDSEDKYLLLLNSTPEAIYGIDVSGNCTFCNPAGLRSLGYRSPQDMLGKNMHCLLHRSCPDGLPYVIEESAIFQAMHDGVESHVTDEILWRRDGTSFPAEYWSYPMRKDGKLVGAVVTFLDISDRRHAEQALRESEERYRGLFENATYGIFCSTDDGRLLDMNPALQAMLGYDSKRELLARKLDTDIYADPNACAAIFRLLASAGRVDGAEVDWKRKDGKLITVRLSGRIVPSGNDSTSRMEVFVQEVNGVRTDHAS